jgi:hypothetical protein
MLPVTLFILAIACVTFEVRSEDSCEPCWCNLEGNVSKVVMPRVPDYDLPTTQNSLPMMLTEFLLMVLFLGATLRYCIKLWRKKMMNTTGCEEIVGLPGDDTDNITIEHATV